MTVNLYNISDDPRVLDKTLGTAVSLNCELLYPSDLLNPRIKISATGWTASMNYMYIQEFGRYYFITETTLDNGGAVLISGRVDPLMSYASAIRALTCNIIRQEATGLTNIVDNQLTLTPQKELEVYLCDKTPFNVREQVTQGNYVLVVAGGEQGGGE